MTVNRFEDLLCWQNARGLTKNIYDLSRAEKMKHDFGLQGQMRRAAVSIMANIAEGFLRRADKEFVQFLHIAMASASELKSHLYVALDQGYLTRDDFNLTYDTTDKVGRMISSLIRYLRHPVTTQTKQTK